MRREAASIHIQKHVRALAARKSYKQQQAAATVIQTAMRAMAARNEYRWRRQNKAACIIQVINSHWHSEYKELNPKITSQKKKTCWHRITKHKPTQRTDHKILWEPEAFIPANFLSMHSLRTSIPYRVRRSIIEWRYNTTLFSCVLTDLFYLHLLFPQTKWRKYYAQSIYKQKKKASLALQCLWRARLARKELRKLRMVSAFLFENLLPILVIQNINLKMPINVTRGHDCKNSLLLQAARETGALKEAKDKLEKRVEELTWRLELEKNLRVC